MSHNSTRESREFAREREGVPWFRAAFGALYPIVYAHRDDASAEREALVARSMLGIGANERVLDLACGNGRHLEAFAKMGCFACGVDLSIDLVARARERRRLAIVRADLRSLPFADGVFDHATCFFTSFGYFETEEENRAVLAEAARVVGRGGRFLLDVPDRAALERALVPVDEFQREGLRVRCARSIDRGRVRKKVTVTNPHGDEVAHFEESVRVYSLDELHRLLRSAGFSVIAEAGSFDGARIGLGDRYVIASERIA